MNNPKPLVSVITVTYNAQAYLERTLQSVLTQTYPNIEYMLIDGASTDATTQIIEKYQEKINFYLSEPDSGLYDAMNKAMQHARGEYLIFMNAGDTFFDKNTLTNAFNACPNADIYYGEAQMLEADTLKVLGLRSQVMPHQTPKKLDWQAMRFGMVVSHQAFVVRRAIAPFYDLQYRFSADIDWVIKCLKKSQTIIYTNQIVANFLLGGLTTQKRKKSLWERYEILKVHFGFFPNLYNHTLIALRGLLLIAKKGRKYWD